MEVPDVRPILAPAISLAFGLLIFLTGESDFSRKFWSLSASILKFLLVLSMLPGSLRGAIYFYQLTPFAPKIEISFRADPLGIFFAAVSSTLWVVTTVYALAYMEPEHAKKRFFGFFAIAVSTTVGIAFAENLFTLFIFYELLTLVTYPLVIHEETPEALRAGKKYLIYTLPAGALILLAICVTFYLTGTTTLSQNGILSLKYGTKILAFLFAAYMTGFGVKAAVMPLHSWLPTAMVAPTPVSALLHAVAVVKAGVFGILRIIFNVFGVELLRELGFCNYLAYIAAFTIIAASFMALLQENLKRRLAYSTVSQLSYIVLGASLLTPSGAMGSIVHLANQAFQKITMFFVAGSIERKTGKRNISELVGMGYKMPFTMATFTLASLGFMGVPLLAGFITKWYVSLGALEAHKPFFVGIMLLSALLNASYWLPIVYISFFKKPPEGDIESNEASPWMLYPCIICALYIIILGTFAEIPALPLSLAKTAAHYFISRR